MRQKSDSFWIVIPAHNEEKYIARVLSKVSRYTKNIVVVDDGSYDKTQSIASNFTKHVLRHSLNLGKGAALKTGCEYVFDVLKGKAVIFMDSDDQHEPKELSLFFDALHSGAAVVFGVRSFDEHMPLFRIIMNRAASLLVYLLFQSYIPDIPSGYKAITKNAYAQIVWDANDYAVEIEIASKVAKRKIPYKIVPITTIYHDFDRGMTILDSLRMIGRILTWKFTL